jgi:ATP-dependent RNA helicase DDX55/SPB4
MPDGVNGTKKKPPPRTWDSIEPALSPWILEAVSALGFAKMTPVQASTLPLFLGHMDVVVEVSPTAFRKINL